MSRKLRARLAALLALALALTLGCGGDGPPRRVFLITIDTLRADHLGCYGYPREVSPFLDRLAAQGLVFTRAFASSSTTTPAHASLFTSLHPPQHQMSRNGVDMHPSLLTLAELFRQQGYDTAAFSTVDFMWTLSRGFAVFDTEKRFFPADHVVDKAVAWLAGKRRSDAFLLWLHLFDVHEWYRPQHVAEDTLRRAAELLPSGDELVEYLRRHRGFSSAHFGGETEMLRAVDRYDGQILAADAALERLFDAAAARGLDRDALWIVTSDHGEGLGNHDFKGHGARLYNEQIRVPLLFYFADERYGRRSIDRLVRHVDVLPTLADLVGASLEGQVFPVVGHSLRPLFEGRDGDFAPRYAFAQRREADEPPAPGWERGDVYSLQSRDFKYIHHSEGEDEFYDLRRDPLETDGRAATREIQQRMRASAVRLKQVMAEQGAELGREGINPKYVEELKALGYL